MAIKWEVFGRLVRADRERLKMKQEDYARLVGLVGKQQGKLSQLERGKIQHPAYETVQALKRKLGITVVPGEESVPATTPAALARAPTPARAVRSGR